MTAKKIALVTGGSRGLGKNISLKLASQGADIILTYNTNREEALKVVAEIESTGQKAIALQLNTGEVKTFDVFFTELRNSLQEVFHADKFDFLINNAGIGIGSSFAETTEEDFNLLVNIHFKGVFFLTQKALGLINDGGRIINLSTGLTRFTAPGYAAYGSVKGAINTLTQYMAKELGSRGITVNAVAPGPTATDFGGGHMKEDEKVHAMFASNTALGRMGRPDDIGGIVALLCSDGAGWVTAQRIEASGGINI
jgi:NAD(P)-dependent dehydrogenase (short-subunit alcohol dehydrogenase family)